MFYRPIPLPFYIGQRVIYPSLKSDTRMRVVGYALNGDVVVQIKGDDTRYPARPIDLKAV